MILICFCSTNTFLPEPLKNILNKNDSLPNENKNLSGKRISRHMSLGDADPGVISPMIWNTYCQLQHEQSKFIYRFINYIHLF